MSNHIVLFLVLVISKSKGIYLVSQEFLQAPHECFQKNVCFLSWLCVEYFPFGFRDFYFFRKQIMIVVFLLMLIRVICLNSVLFRNIIIQNRILLVNSRIRIVRYFFIKVFSFLKGFLSHSWGLTPSKDNIIFEVYIIDFHTKLNVLIGIAEYLF